MNKFILGFLICLASAFIGFANEPLANSTRQTNEAFLMKYNLLVLNIKKRTHSSWNEKGFLNQLKNVDILLLQEAKKTVAPVKGYNTDFYKSWGNTGLRTYRSEGLELLSREILFSPTSEPILQTPKLTSIEIIKLNTQNLVLVNTHGINFRTFKHFKLQMDQVTKKLSKLQGPMIWAGDFNTWSQRRTSYLRNITKNLGLTEVKFKNRSEYLLELDKVFTKGLKIESAKQIQLGISDHEPLYLEFYIPAT